ncbi:MAG: lactate utilization protein [Fimbriimonadaceae bacterium]|nr:lactate utilization protein [Alphaproteobacteria bacterium]
MSKQKSTEDFPEMDSRRQAVLGKVRQSLQVSGDENARRTIVRGRLENHPRGTIPARGQKLHIKQVDLFEEMAKAVDTTVDRVKTEKEILPAVQDYLRRHNLPARLVHGSDAYLSNLNWAELKALEHRQGPAIDGDLVSLTRAKAGIAESGTLIMTSGADNPVTLNFLPDVAVVVIRAADIAGDYETAWDRLREKFGAGQMPRTVNMVTGPSRTADIEQTLLLGAHGPRSLHIIIVGS